jgi:hypothetical protein
MRRTDDEVRIDSGSILGRHEGKLP